MFIEMIEQLRCIEAHEESWLVATFHQFENRILSEGELGCHVCGARYPVVRGVAHFGVEPGTTGSVAQKATNSRDNAGPTDAMELAAFLGLSEHGKSIALTGAFCDVSLEIADGFGARVFAVNPNIDPLDSESVGVMQSTRLFPLAPESLDGIALDHEVRAEQVENSISCLRPTGRLVLSAKLPVPAGVEVLARDLCFTVAQKLAPLTTLGRASR